LQTTLTLRKVITSLLKIIDNSKEERKRLTYDKYKGGEERNEVRRLKWPTVELGD